MNDTMAAGAYDYMWEHNLQVGRDYSIVGYDNKVISEYLRPLLTTNDIQLAQLGKTAARLMVMELDDENEGDRESAPKDSVSTADEEAVNDGQRHKKIYHIESKMIVRDSVRRPD